MSAFERYAKLFKYSIIPKDLSYKTVLATRSTKLSIVHCYAALHPFNFWWVGSLEWQLVVRKNGDASQANTR